MLLIKGDGLGRVVAGDILPDISGCWSVWQLCRCCYFSVREGRAGALRWSCFRCHGLKDDAGLTLEESGLCDGLFYVAVLADCKMYLRLKYYQAFLKPLHFHMIYMGAHMHMHIWVHHSHDTIPSWAMHLLWLITCEVLGMLRAVPCVRKIHCNEAQLRRCWSIVIKLSHALLCGALC